MDEVHDHELADRARELLRRVREDGASYAVRDDHGVIARLIPVHVRTEVDLPTRARARLEELAMPIVALNAAPSVGTDQLAILDDMERLAIEMAEESPTPASAVDAVREQRREL